RSPAGRASSARVTGPVVGLVIGSGIGLGTLGVVLPLVSRYRPTVELRVLPYVRDVPLVVPAWAPQRTSARPSSALAALLGPLMAAAAQRLGRLLGGQDSVRRRLQRAGSGMGVDEFRLTQVRWGLAGFGGCLVVGLLGPGRQPGKAVTWLVVCAGAALVAIM